MKSPNNNNNQPSNPSGNISRNPNRVDPTKQDERDNDPTRIKPHVKEPDKNDPTQPETPGVPKPPTEPGSGKTKDEFNNTNSQIIGFRL